MSNQAVGNVYQTIIDEVISSSRVDFEESGVDDSVLEELRKGWQRKLSQLDVARFPWDPKPEPPPPAKSTTSTTSAAAAASHNHGQVQFSPELSLPNDGANDAVAQSSVKLEPGIAKPDNVKREVGSQYANYNGTDHKNSVAASRAAQQLQLQYGMRAAGSINAIQQQAQQQPGQSVNQQNAGQQGTTDSAASQQEAQGAGAANQLTNGQVDGPCDSDTVEGILLRHGRSGDLHELCQGEIDAMLHKQIAAKAKAMEGGGLMLPLREATKIRPGRTSQQGKGKGKEKSSAVAAFDGGDDEEPPVDEDAINSDLDDPDDDHDDDEVDDEGLGHIMLCMYDKVQRVKNKWKCTLKDGVLTVNGKEYVFHKATGEYEW